MSGQLNFVVQVADGAGDFGNDRARRHVNAVVARREEDRLREANDQAAGFSLRIQAVLFQSRFTPISFSFEVFAGGSMGTSGGETGAGAGAAGCFVNSAGCDVGGRFRKCRSGFGLAYRLRRDCDKQNQQQREHVGVADQPTVTTARGG